MEAAFYVGTSVGGSAVIVFFVISGYWVGGPALRRELAGSFSLWPYLLRRLTRLWVVLVPALAVTAACVVIGARLDPSRTYFEPGNFHTVSGSVSSIDDIGTLLGNLAFVQGLHVPEYGGNGPLWSLAYEFWFYLLWPLLLMSMRRSGRSRWTAVLTLALAAMIAGPIVVLYFAVWLLGVLVHVIVQRRGRVLAASRQWLKDASSGLILLIAVAAAEFGGVPKVVGDSLIGLGAAAYLLLLAGAEPARNGIGRRLARFGAACGTVSYSLYAVHLPVVLLSVVLLRFYARVENPYLLFAGSTAAGVLSGIGLYWLAERRTDAIYKWVLRFSPPKLRG